MWTPPTRGRFDLRVRGARAGGAARGLGPHRQARPPEAQAQAEAGGAQAGPAEAEARAAGPDRRRRARRRRRLTMRRARCSTFLLRLPIAVAAILLAAPATASAQRVEDVFFNSVIPSRVDHLIGFATTSSPSTRRASRSGRSPCGSAGNPPLCVRQRERGRRPVRRDLPAEPDPHAPLPEPGRPLPRPAAHRPRAAARAGPRRPRPRRRRARRDPRAPRLHDRRVPGDGARDRRGTDQDLVGGGRGRAAERRRDRTAAGRHGDRPLRWSRASARLRDCPSARGRRPTGGSARRRPATSLSRRSRAGRAPARSSGRPARCPSGARRRTTPPSGR